VHIHTANFLEQHPHYDIIKQHQNYELDNALQQHEQLSNRSKKFQSGFHHFAHFIGHGNKHRLHLASYLWANHPKLTLQTYHGDVTKAYHREFVGLEDLMFDLAVPRTHVDWAFDFLKTTPMKLDNITSDYIGPNLTYNILDHYADFFMELVSLTYTGGNTFYVDEKIWRPILMKTPFMVQGPAGLILNLRRLGFRTFDRWWDEGYSEDPHDCQVPAMIGNIQRLSMLGIQDLQCMYDDMDVVLEHNLQRLLELVPDDFNKTFTK
jgi:hypothetical protein